MQNYKNIIPSSHKFSNNNIDGYNDIGVIKVASTSKGVRSKKYFGWKVGDK